MNNICMSHDFEYYYNDSNNIRPIKFDFIIEIQNHFILLYNPI